MNTSGLLLSLLAVLFAAILVYYQYYYGQRPTNDSKILSFLRLISVLGVLLLLINPQFESKRIELQKPILFFTADNSSSISHSDLGSTVKNIRQLFLDDKELNERFDLSYFRFGTTISNDTLLRFNEDQSNLYKAIQDINALSARSRVFCSASFRRQSDLWKQLCLYVV